MSDKPTKRGIFAELYKRYAEQTYGKVNKVYERKAQINSNTYEQDVTAYGDRNEYNHKNPDYYSIFTGCDCIL